MSSDSTHVLRAVILGTDAVLAARPATPIQLARACMRAGFDFVAPVSWGEELLAERTMKALQYERSDASIVVCCPLVADALRDEAGKLPRLCASASPPVATARYLRSAFRPRAVHVTYAGACTGATAPDIDACLLPLVLLNSLFEAGLPPEEEPNYFEELVPPDRSRYASLPGGVPDPARLLDMTGLRLREATPATLRAILPLPEAPERILIDLEAAVGCVCARDRFAAAQLEPPRATSQVVRYDFAIELGDERLREVLEPAMARMRQAQAPEELSDKDSAVVPAGSTVDSSALWSEGAAAIEPWVVLPRPFARPHPAPPSANGASTSSASPPLTPRLWIPAERGATTAPDFDALVVGNVSEVVVPISLAGDLAEPADLPRATPRRDAEHPDANRSDSHTLDTESTETEPAKASSETPDGKSEQ